MSKFGLDFSKFRKVHSDEHTSTFEHYEGHQVKIAHNKLSKKLKDQLNQIPTKPKKQKEPVKMADGGVAKEEPSDFDEMNAALNPFHSDPGQYEKQHDEAMASLPKSPEDAAAMSAPPSAPSMGQPDPAPQDQVPASAAAPDQSQPQSFNDPYGMMATTQAQIGALGEQSAGQQGAAMVQGEVGRKQAMDEALYRNQAQSNLEDYQNNNNALTAERAALQKDISNFHVDPQRYINNMSTGSKITSAIGLILGGMGAGLTHGPNLAFQYLQNQVDRDIDAQKAELGKKQNLLSHNFQATQDLRQAYDLTRLHTNDILSSQLRAEAAKMAPSMAQANMLNIAGQFDGQSAQLQHSLALQRTMMNAGGGDESGFQNRMQFLRMNGQEPMAKDLEAKHLPGIPGQASVEITPDNRKEWTHLNNLDKSYQEAQGYLNNVNKLGAGWQNANKAQGQSLEKSMELEVGQLEGLGRFTPEEAKRYKSLIPDLTGTHFTDQDQARLSQLQTELRNHKSSLLEGLGMKAPAQSGSTAAPSQEIQRVTKDGRVAIFDQNKKFLRYK